MRKDRLKGIKIIYEDCDLLVIDKPPGLLTMGMDKNQTNTAAYILSDYLRKGCLKSHKQAFVVHRLDRGTSGLLIFAKSEKVKSFLKETGIKPKRNIMRLFMELCRKRQALSPHIWLKIKSMLFIQRRIRL
jgi:23S rRNA-/tRNA-specific pseudouridylate synthase